MNKNAIPNDPEKPFVTSGIRVGSPAMTTRGLGADGGRQVADLIADALEAHADDAKLAARARQGERAVRAVPGLRPGDAGHLRARLRPARGGTR